MDKFFTENEIMNYLNEDMYSSQRKSFAKVDKLFQEIVDNAAKAQKVKDIDKSLVAKNFKAIEAIIKAKFNIELDMIAEYNRRYPRNIAFTTFPMSAVKKAVESEATQIIATKKSGYKYIKIKEANVTFEMISIFAMADLEGYVILNLPGGGKKEIVKHDASKLTGAILTSILLHEIGHNLFLRFHYTSSNGEHIMKIENGVKSSPTIVIHEDKIPYQSENQLIKFLVTLVVSAIVTVIAVKLSFVALIALTWAGSSVSIASQISRKQKDENYKRYMRDERMANMLPFQYGYGKELFQGTVLIHSLFSLLYPGYSMYDRKSNSRGYNYETIITRDILHMIEDELKNPANSKEDIQHLKDLKSYYYNVIRDLQREYGLLHTDRSDIDSVRDDS